MSEASRSKCRCEIACANLILRLWVGLRLFMAGIDKFRDKATKEYVFNTWDVLKKNAQPLYDNMTAETIMGKAPMLVSSYVFILAYALIIVGIWVIVGLFTRTSLLLAGLLLVSLSFGLMALPDDDQAVLRGFEVAITAFALVTCSHNIFSLDGLLFRSKKSE